MSQNEFASRGVELSDLVSLQALQALNGQQTLNLEEFTNLVFHKMDTNDDSKVATYLGLTFLTEQELVAVCELPHLDKSTNLSSKPHL